MAQTITPEWGKERLKTLVPDYYEKFSCIGSDCEDTCCAGWSISIDPSTKKKYAAVPSTKLDLNKGIKGDTFRMQGENCVFLTEQKLCKIQLTLGEEYLTTMCATYPRSFNLVDGLKEASATLSCPEVARLVLLNPEGIQVMYSEKEFLGPIEKRYKTDEDFQNVRDLVLGVLQDRRYPVSDRMVILAMYFTDTAQYKGSEQAFLNEDLRGLLSDIKASPDRQFHAVKNILAMLKDESKENQRYKECYALMDEYLGDSEGKYISAYKDFYRPFMEEHEYMIENYLVNYAYRTVKFTGSIEAFFLMAVYYSLLKFHLIGVAGANQELDETTVVKVVQTFTKRFEHHPGTGMIADYFIKKGLAELHDIVVLLKDE